MKAKEMTFARTFDLSPKRLRINLTPQHVRSPVIVQVSPKKGKLEGIRTNLSDRKETILIDQDNYQSLHKKKAIRTGNSPLLSDIQSHNHEYEHALLRQLKINKTKESPSATMRRMPKNRIRLDDPQLPGSSQSVIIHETPKAALSPVSNVLTHSFSPTSRLKPVQKYPKIDTSQHLANWQEHEKDREQKALIASIRELNELLALIRNQSKSPMRDKRLGRD